MTRKQSRPLYCSFCGKSPKEVGPFVETTTQGEAARICVRCTAEAKRTFEEAAKKDSARNRRLVSIPKPKQVYTHLGDYVVGQDRAKRRLSVAVTNHYKRLLDAEARAADESLLNDPELDSVVVDKSNVLLIGPTGVGKTLLARTLAQKLNVPFAIGDATTLTEAGYVGEDVENLLLKLLRETDFDLDAAERGIIYLDEIDKLHKTGHNVSITRDVSGEGVQQALLKMIEGYVCNVPPQGGRKHPEQQYIQMDTTNILFICGGSFNGLEDIISARLGRGGIGFNRSVKEKEDERTELLRQVTQDDLRQYGMIPELIGRLPVIATLDAMGVDDLARVLTEPKDALLKQYRKLCAMDKVGLEFTPSAVREIAKLAKTKGTGARGLRTVVEDLMDGIMYELPEHRLVKLIIDDAVVRQEKSPFERKGEAA